MSETGGDAPEPVTPTNSHRAEPPPKTMVDRVLAPLAAVIVVAVVIVLLIIINGHSSNSTPAATGPSTPPVSVPPTVAPSTSALATSPSPSRSGSPHRTAPASAKPSKSATIADSATSPPAPNAMAPVQVLNNSRRTGLAHEVAAEVQARGWTISLIGNLQGTIPVPTIYYAPGDAAAAAHLAREFSSVQRVEPNSAAGLHASGLTLVLTADWAD